jgi:hypothetical protein
VALIGYFLYPLINPPSPFASQFSAALGFGGSLIYLIRDQG